MSSRVDRQSCAKWTVAFLVGLAFATGQPEKRVAAASPVFGPVDVVRRTGSPDLARWTFAVASPGAGYILCVDNGGQRDQYAPVTSANVKFNGTAIFQPNDFKKKVTMLSRSVTLLRNNELTAELAGSPGSGIAVWIEPGASCNGVTANAAPVITSAAVTTATWLAPYAYHVTATDTDHDALVFSLTTAPTGMTIASGTGDITWMPPGPGTVNASVRVDDGHGGNATQSFAVTVGMPANRPPQIRAIANRRIPSGVPFQLGLAANDPDAGDTLTFSLQSGPAGAAVTPSPILAWTPGVGQLGFHPLTVRVQDAAGASASTSFTIEVIDSQGAPILDPQPDATTPAGVPFTRAITATDPNPGDALTFSLVGGPSGMTVSPQGTLAWTPTQAQLGAHQVTVKVQDNAGLSAVGTFAITVSVAAVTQPPTAIDDLYAVRKLTTLTVPAPGVLANDLNPGGQPLTAQLITPPTKGALSLSTNGGFSYTPTPPAPDSTAPMLKYTVFHSPGTITGGANRTRPVVADLNRDGIPEIVFLEQAQFSVRRLNAVRGDTGALVWALDAYQLNGNPKIVLSSVTGGDGALPIGDLDGDGYLEILSVHSDNEGDSINPTKLRNRIIAFNHDGSYRWTSDDILDGVNVTQSTGMFRIDLADLDGDGLPEIVACHIGKSLQTPAGVVNENLVTVFNHDGHIRWTRRVPGIVAHENLAIADIDLDGHPEIVIGGAALDYQGNIKWNSKSTNPGVVDVAIANLDSDPSAEIVYLDRFGAIHCYESTGAKKWGPVAQPGSFSFGQLAIGDTDGDGLPEILLPRATAGSAVEVRDNNGNLLRTMSLPGSLNMAAQGGSITVFDLNGDGRPEVIYQAMQGSFDTLDSRGSLFIFDGPTGSLLHEKHASRGSSTEAGPIVADVDGNGSAEIVTAGWGNTTMLHVFTAAAGKWAQTRPIWNQDSYHVTNVETNGRIPAYEPLNWLTPGLNNYRVNVAFGRERTGDADQFTYTASDGSLTSNVATVRLDILPPNTAPSILSIPPLSAAPSIEYLYAVRAVDPDAGEVLAYSLTQGPAGMTIDASTGLVRWTPPPAASGAAMVVVKVVDSQNQSASQQFTITIGSPVIVPSVVGQSMASAQTAIVGEGLSSGAIVNATSATVLAGAVISQEPVAGSMVASGAAINLVVSSGPALVPVPYVIGKTAAAAAALLQNQGFSATIVRAFSNTVPDGVVMAQTPAAGTPQVPGPVSVTVSVGSGLALRLKRAVTTADASIPFTAVAYNLGYAETPAPPLTFAVTPALVPSVGALPTVGANAIAPALDTRGAFRVTATDAATGRTASAEFAVTYPRGSGSQRTMSDAIGSMNEAMADIDTLIRQGRRVLATNDTSAAHALLNQIVQRWKQVDIVELRFATPFGMPQGFFPSPADLPSLGLTPTAEDLLAEQVLTDALADLQAWIDGLRAPTTSMAQLRTLADQFNSRAGRLHALHLSEAGVIKSQALLTLLLCQRLPELYSALTDELAAVVASSGIPPGGANDFASGPSAVEAESLLAEELTVIALEYAVEKITDALNPIQKLREEGFEEAAWSVEVVLAAHHFRQYAQGLPLTAVVSGASQSFRAFEIDYAFIEGVFDTDHPTSNVVLTIGPDLLERLGLSTDVAFDDVKTAIGTAVNTVVNAAVMFRALTKVYDWMKGGSTSPSDLNNILEDSFQSRPAGFRGCIFTTVPECGQLVYEDGLRSVYETDTGFGIPVPILFIAYNKTTGQMYVDTPVFIPTKK